MCVEDFRTIANTHLTLLLPEMIDWIVIVEIEPFVLLARVQKATSRHIIPAKSIPCSAAFLYQ